MDALRTSLRSTQPPNWFFRSAHFRNRDVTDDGSGDGYDQSTSFLLADVPLRTLPELQLPFVIDRNGPCP